MITSREYRVAWNETKYPINRDDVVVQAEDRYVYCNRGPILSMRIEHVLAFWGGYKVEKGFRPVVGEKCGQVHFCKRNPRAYEMAFAEGTLLLKEQDEKLARCPTGTTCTDFVM